MIIDQLHTYIKNASRQVDALKDLVKWRLIIVGPS